MKNEIPLWKRLLYIALTTLIILLVVYLIYTWGKQL